MKYNARGSYVTGLLLGAAILFVFYDIGYLAYFNSLFGEPVSMVFMLLTFALGLRLTSQEKPTTKGLTLFLLRYCFWSPPKFRMRRLGLPLH